MRMLPETTVERLSLYRRFLIEDMASGNKFIFSHDLGKAIRVKSVQVRKDIMLLGFNGSTSKGYEIKSLIKKIDKVLGFDKKRKIALVGLSTLGGAVEEYVISDTRGFDIYASFLMFPETRAMKMPYPVYPIDKMPAIIKQQEIKTAILAMPPIYAQQQCDILVASGIKAILNLCSTLLRVPADVLVQDIDFITCIEKLCYFSGSYIKKRKVRVHDKQT